MKKIFPLLFFVAFVFVACDKDNDEQVSTQQTVLMYLPWSGNLTSYFEQNIKDFETAVKTGLLKNERLLVFFSSSPTNASLFEITYKKGNTVRTELQTYTDLPFTTAGGITTVLNDVKTFAPAERYAITIGCHGLGWLPVSSGFSRTAAGLKPHWEYEGEFMTRYFGGTSAAHQTDISTLAEGIKNADIGRLDYILFDDCYMSTIEVAYELKEVTRYLISCPTEVMAYGMPYHKIGKYLIGKIDQVGLKGVCDEFLSFYESYTNPYGTIGVIDCNELDALAFIMRLINSLDFDRPPVSSIQRMDGYFPTVFFDFGDYVKLLCANTVLLEAFNQQLEKTVPYKAHTERYYTNVGPNPGSKILVNAYSGITISDPTLNGAVLPYLSGTAWFKSTH